MSKQGCLKVAVVWMLLVFAGWQFASGLEAARKAIRFDKLVGADGKVTENGILLISGDRIESVITDSKLIPNGTDTIDLYEYTGLPGLIDVHTHMTYFWDEAEGTNPWDQHRSDRMPAVTVFLAQENARKCLESGVTTVRDLGASDYVDIAMRDLVNQGAMKGPRMFVAGHGLFINYLSARPPAGPVHPGLADGPAEVMKVVRQEIFGAGADVVKMYASTGSASDLSGQQTFTFEEIEAATRAAHALGVKIAVHSYGPEAARAAIRAGVDSIEHATGLEDEDFAEMARRGVFYVPTIDHNRYYAENAEIFGYSPAVVEELKEFIQRNLETTRRAHRAGVQIAMGSDAVFTMFGENTLELEWFIKAGMTPKEALQTATHNAAILLGKEGELGDLAEGYYADIIAVRGDPLKDIRAVIDNVEWVMKGGEVVVDRTH